MWLVQSAVSSDYIYNYNNICLECILSYHKPFETMFLHLIEGEGGHFKGGGVKQIYFESFP